MTEPHGETSSARTVPAAVDAVLGVAAMATSTAVSVTRRFGRAAAPVGRLIMHPPILNERLHPARLVEAFADRGYVARTSAGDDLNRIIAAVVPPVVDEVLDSLDLTSLVRERVDIDALVATVDIAGIVDRLDIDEIVSKVDIDGILRQVDVDAIVAKVDIDAVVRQVDVNAIARQVDVDAIVRQVDIDAIARQIDIDAIVAQVDIDAIAKRIDVDAIADRIEVDAIVSRVDIDAIVRRLDLVGIAEEVVNGIDLPEIIRQSTGSMASDVVRDVRMESIEADMAIARLIDRVIRRRRARHTEAPGEPAQQEPPEERQP
jgi:hypothetical protein